MSAAAIATDVIRNRQTARPGFVGADCPELLMHAGMRACRADVNGAVVAAATNAASIEQPSGGTEEAVEADEPPQRAAWSRQGWTSTAAFTIGRPPRAPRVM